MKNNRIKDISINILTYRTDKKILDDCIRSINIPIPINIIENSKKFINKNRFKKINKKIRIFCTGKILDMLEVTTMVYLKQKPGMC